MHLKKTRAKPPTWYKKLRSTLHHLIYELPVRRLYAYLVVSPLSTILFVLHKNKSNVQVAYRAAGDVTSSGHAKYRSSCVLAAYAYTR